MPQRPRDARWNDGDFTAREHVLLYACTSRLRPTPSHRLNSLGQVEGGPFLSDRVPEMYRCIVEMVQGRPFASLRRARSDEEGLKA
jgi:hypothetical protein